MIHPSAYVDPSSEIHESVEIGPMAYVGPGCVLHENVTVGPHAVIERLTEVGSGTQVCANAHIGGAPQDISYRGEDTRIVIGKNNLIREFCTIHRASTKEDWVTRVGDRNLLMSYVHIAHDGNVGNDIIITNAAQLAGHVQVEDFAMISGLVAVHQFCRIGTMAMVGGMTRVPQDVPPYCLVEGSDPVIHGLNSVGLKRRGVSPEARSELKKAVHIYRDKSLLMSEVQEQWSKLTQYPEVERFIQFFADSRRHVIRR